MSTPSTLERLAGSIALIDAFIPRAIATRGADVLRRARLLVAASIVASLGALYSAFLRQGDFPAGAMLFTIASPLLLLAPVVLRATGSLAFASQTFLSVFFLLLASLNLGSGGAVVAALYVSPFVPMVASLLAGWRAGCFWTAMVVAQVLSLYWLSAMGHEPLFVVDVVAEDRVQYRAVATITVIGMAVIAAYEWLNREALDMVAAALERERLMHHEIAQREKLASVGRLASGLAHEINNPLSFVWSNVSQLEQVARESELSSPELSSDDVREMILDSKVGLERIRELASWLRRFTRDDGPMTPVHLPSMLQQTLQLVAPRTRRSAETRFEIEAGAQDATTLGHQSQLEQVVLGLLLNAADAVTPPGRIDLRLRDGENAWEVEIEDDGCGIEAEVLDHIFDPFFSTKEVGDGKGLGLSVSHAIVQSHDGSLGVSSRPGGGTTFRVSLPKAPAGDVPVEED